MQQNIALLLSVHGISTICAHAASLRLSSIILVQLCVTGNGKSIVLIATALNPSRLISYWISRKYLQAAFMAGGQMEEAQEFCSAKGWRKTASGNRTDPHSVKTSLADTQGFHILMIQAMTIVLKTLLNNWSIQVNISRQGQLSWVSY